MQTYHHFPKSFLTKSIIFALLISLSAFLIFGCQNSSNSQKPDNEQKPTEQEKTTEDQNPAEQPEDQFPDKVIWEPKTEAEETFITVSAEAWENDGHLRSDFTGKAPIINFEDEIDLTGYKYLNIEAYCPDDGYHLIGFTGFSENPHEKVARLQSFCSKEATVFQTDFGVNNKQWPDMSTGNLLINLSTSNKIKYILTYSFDPLNPVSDIPDIRICVKKIYATNQKLTNDTSKDKIVFKAIEPEGHKFTTVEQDNNWDSNIIYLGNNFNLEEYKYLNLEVSSPNCNNYSVNIESWTEVTRTDIESSRKIEFSRILTNEMQVYQIPFGVFKEYWFDWREAENYKKPITDNIISYIYFSTQDTENDWQWHAGVDVYVKSITATNTLLEVPDTSKDKVVYTAIESEGRKITTKKDPTYLATGYFDLEGYNYLNIEIASPNSKDYVVGLCPRDYYNNRNGTFDYPLTEDFKIFQIPFGKGNGYREDWSSGEKVLVPYDNNGLNSFAFWACDAQDNWNTVAGVDIYIKRIWATNTELKN